MKKDKKIVIIITLILVLGIFNILPGNGLGKEITNFYNDDDLPVVVELSGDSGYCTDATTKFSIPVHKGKIEEASLKLTFPVDEKGRALMNPRLDVGLDGDYEWEYTGTGYGAIGHQQEFSTGMSRRIVAIGNSKYNNLTKIYLPVGAHVSDASLELEGGNLKTGETYIALSTYNGNVYYIKSNNDKTFGSPQLVGNIGNYMLGIGLGDFDNDGDNDIVVNNGQYNWPSSTGYIYLFNKTGAGNSFSMISDPVGYTDYYRNSDFAVGDFNNDGNLDFIKSEMNQNIYFFKGFGNNSFNRTQITKTFNGGTPYGKDAADFNLDGNLDFVTGCSMSGSVYVFMGNGDGTFIKPPRSVVSGTSSSPKCAIAGDFNMDGNPDIITKDYSFSGNTHFQFIAGNGDGSFKGPIDTGVGGDVGSWSYLSGDGFDFNLDGNQDIVTFASSGPNPGIRVYWGSLDAHGQFKLKSDYKTIGTISGSSLTSISTPPSVLFGGCDNMKIDIGEHGGTPDESYNGAFTTKEKIHFGNRLNSLIKSPPENLKQITDDYGNTLVEIPIRFTTDAIGNVLLKNLSIRYTYSAIVDENPHNKNLVNELNDLIPKYGDGEFNVYFQISSDLPGKVEFSDLYIRFNEAPTTKTIPDVEINEDTNHPKLISLINYFNDDYELPEDLTYTVESYTNKEYVKVSIFDGVYVQVDATKDPDWFGETKIMIEARDSGKGITHSNEFTVTINPINDPPRVGVNIPNIDLLTNSENDKYDLDASFHYFFYDVDSPDLYFQAIVFDEENSGKFEYIIHLSIANDTNLLTVNSLESQQIGIPVRIYCSDSPEIRTMGLTQLLTIPTYQQIIVNVTKLGSGKREVFPPRWKDIEDIQLTEDELKMNWLNLNNYTSDADDTPEELTYTVESVTNSAYINIEITTSKDRTQNILSIIPEQDFDGEAIVILRVEDDDHNYAFEKFTVTMNPLSDIPTVQILSPSNNTKISGIVTISGTAYDAEGELDLVELKIGNNQWQTVNGWTFWNYDWNTNDYTTSTDFVKITVRSKDLEGFYSFSDSIYLQIDNIVIDTDNDEIPDIYDSNPNDPLNWVDSDGDGIGDNSDNFPNDETQWLDTDGDGYGDNQAGNSPDQFPYDPTQWLDTDGDGYGDNLEGNKPDYYPNNEKRYLKETKVNDEGMSLNELTPWFVLILLIIFDILIFIYIIVKQKEVKNKKEEN